MQKGSSFPPMPTLSEKTDKKIASLVFDGRRYIPSPLLKHWQTKKIKNIISIAYDTVPFYKKLYDGTQTKPDSFRLIGDLSKFPVIDKKTLKHSDEKERINPLVSSSNYTWGSTSGSTGEPFRFPVDGRRGRFFWESAQPKESGVVPNFIPRFLLRHGFSEKEIKDFKFAEIRMNCRRLGKNSLCIQTPKFLQDPPSAIKQLYEFKPDYLDSRTTLIIELARLVRGLGINDRPAFRFVLTHGETINNSQKKFIEEALDCIDLYEHYGLEEVGDIAEDCEKHHGLHVHDDLFFLEILDENGSPVAPGRHGRIIVSYFYNEVFPFIRYDTGDRGALITEKCECGIPSPRLTIEGRSGGFLRIGNRRFNYAEFQMLFSGLSDLILRYQLAKTSEKTVELRIIPIDSFSSNEKAWLQSLFYEKFGFVPEIKVVADIPPLASGKNQMILDETDHRV